MRILRKALKTYKELKEKCFGYISDELKIAVSIDSYFDTQKIMMLGSKRLFEKNFQCGTKNLKFLKKKGIKTKGR